MYKLHIYIYVYIYIYIYYLKLHDPCRQMQRLKRALGAWAAAGNGLRALEARVYGLGVRGLGV